METLKFDLKAYPYTHHDPKQPKPITIPGGSKIKIIHHPFPNQPHDSLISYKGQKWVVVKTSLDISKN